MGSFLVYVETLEPYLSQFDVEKHEIASVMGICASLVVPKSENVEKVRIFNAFLKGSRSHETAKESLQPSEPEHFLVIWGRFLVYESDFGSLWDHFGTIVR